MAIQLVLNSCRVLHTFGQFHDLHCGLLRCFLLPFWSYSYAPLDNSMFSFVLQPAAMVFISTFIWSCLYLYIVSVLARPGTRCHEAREQHKMPLLPGNCKPSGSWMIELHVCCTVLIMRNLMCFILSYLQLKALM